MYTHTEFQQDKLMIVGLIRGKQYNKAANFINALRRTTVLSDSQVQYCNGMSLVLDIIREQ